ncbi:MULTISPECIES: phage terminase small subunit P27 family [unclassified Moraxella]|uniref:phage terminase small subunit P27 family n=1 Tax=unclassified Moraxella TaxID=2685852 RepID=UPI00359D2421
MGGIATVAGRGRKPKPAKLKELNGNAGKRAINKNEPKFSSITNIEPPEWLPPLAFEIWRLVMPELLSNKVLTIADVHNIECFCVAYARWREAQEHIKYNGIVITNEETGSMAKNPAVTVMNETARQLVQFGSLLGLDPSSRARLTGGAKQENVSNPFADL